MRYALPILFCLLVAACATPREPGATVPAIGDQAPTLELPLTSGDRIALQSAVARGPVLLVFYRGLF
jgi:hypothetical protein